MSKQVERKKFTGFEPSLPAFLQLISDNNNRDWFAENKPRYEQEVLFPALDFVAAMQSPLKRISPNFNAIPKRMGGSIMRVYRDTRFSPNKSPYKTNLGIQFRHQMGRDVHAPGYYFHVDPYEVFVAVGMWHPDSQALAGVRGAMVERPSEWKRAVNGKRFKEAFTLGGESLKRPPRGFDAEHPLVEDLKRKDYIAVRQLGHDTLYSSELPAELASMFRSATPFMRFLCTALEVPF